MKQTVEAGKILLLEDDDGIARLLTRRLEKRDIVTVHASDVQSAFERILEEEPDLMVLDYQLKDGTCVELIHQMERRFLSIPFIIITGYGDERVAVDMMKRGAQDYLVKKDDFLETAPREIDKVLKQITVENELRVTRRTLENERAQFLSIYNSMNEIMYVIDPDTHEVLFANQALQKLIGRDPVGELYGESLQGFGGIRELCAGEIILRETADANYWEYHHKPNHRDYLVMSKTIRWVDGRQVLFELAVDITERKQGEEKLKMVLLQTVESLGVMAEMRDPYTAGHQRRVAELAVEIGGEMGLLEDTLESIHIAAMLHDIGKITIPSEILSKPSRLTPLEFELIKTHSISTYEVLKSIHFTWPVADIVLQHHEKMDGSGYPKGLEGKHILLEARILTVADVMEAISSHRPYRPALGVETGLEEIKRLSGVHFDPDVVSACVRLFEEKSFVFTSPERQQASEYSDVGE